VSTRLSASLVKTFNSTYIEEEKKILAPYAAKNSKELLIKRLVFERHESERERLDFQRDRDRIIHSRAFRRLMHKTQVFYANKGDHYRNRLTHSLEVSQIATSIARILGLNIDLTEAIALGHDLGHTPFGHVVERTLHEITTGKKLSNGDVLTACGGFKHNFQSLQVTDNIEQMSGNKAGMNLTLAVREGILKHTGPKLKIPIYDQKTEKITYDKQFVNYSSLDLSGILIDKPSFTLEGQVVGIADEIAQVTHDLEDGLRAGIINLSDIENAELIKKVCEISKLDLGSLKGKEVVEIRNTLIRSLIGYLINDVADASLKNLNSLSELPERFDSIPKQITFKSDSENSTKYGIEELQGLLTNLVINSEEVSVSDCKAALMIEKMFISFYNSPQQLPDYVLTKYYKKKGRSLERKNINKYTLQKDTEFIRAISDHISSMTDQYASRIYNKLYFPQFS
jgi:dGTPase